MAISWRDEDIRNFFGCAELCVGEAIPGNQIVVVEYAGRLLKYSIWFQITEECVLISGNDTLPFGADSLYEIAVPCDSVVACVDPYVANQTGLAFWYGDPTQKMNLTMMLLKRPDGDLKVWPESVLPQRHPILQKWQQSDPKARNRYNPRIQD